MNPAIIEAIGGVLNGLLKSTEKIIDAGDPEKLAKAVNEMNKGVDTNYELQRKVVMDDSKLSADEKLERLSKIAEAEKNTKLEMTGAINKNREQVAEIAKDVFYSLVTGGAYLIPKAYQQFLPEANNLQSKAESAKEHKTDTIEV